MALVRAYLSEAPLVLFDEISMGLAPVVVDEIFEFLAGLRRAGRSLLVVEQYIPKALALAEIMDHYFNAAESRRPREGISR